MSVKMASAVVNAHAKWARRDGRRAKRAKVTAAKLALRDREAEKK